MWNLCISTHLYFGSHLIIGSFSFKNSTVQDFRSLALRLSCRPRSATSPPNSDRSWWKLWTFVASFWQIFVPRGATSSDDEGSNCFIVWKDVPQSDMLQNANPKTKISELQDFRYIRSFDDFFGWISHVSDFVLTKDNSEVLENILRIKISYEFTVNSRTVKAKRTIFGAYIDRMSII